MATLGGDEKRKILARIALFAGLGAADLDDLAKVATERALKRGEELFHKGDAGSNFYAIVSGRLKAFATTEQGTDVVFSILGPGETFGEIGALVESERTATVTAVEPCLLLVLRAGAVLDLVRKRPDAAIALMRALADRVRQLSDRVEDAFLNLPLRLARRLLHLAQEQGRAEGDGVRIAVRLSQAEWGSLVGASRESVNHQLGVWREQGLVRLEAGQLVILRLDALERLAEHGVL